MNELQNAIEELQQIINAYDNIVFFGGAGVSTESGIPDFRSVDGLYHQQYDYPPETILSHTFYRSHPEEFFRFYRNKMLFPKAQPNAAHKKLAELERAGKVRAVVTQNIDGLHQAAGSKTVLELHGSVLRNYCEKCHQFYGLDAILNSTGIPHCEKLIDYFQGNKLVVINKSATPRDTNADLLIQGPIGEVFYSIQNP